MKSKDKGESQNIRYRKLHIIVATVMIILILTSIFIYFYPNQPIQPKAAIIDQLGSSQLSPQSRYRNQSFIAVVHELLYKRFVEVDYYSDNATVDNYKRLSSMGYKLIVWRAHTALNLNPKYVAVCTSESAGSKNYDQYSNDQLTLCNITGDPKLYFSITPSFIKECMNGQFEDTIVILMSCNGLKQDYYKTADAFLEKGAKVFISWDEWIDSSDNDQATTLLLQYLINENNTISQATNKIPSYSYLGVPCRLGFYPSNSEAAGYRIPNYRQDSIASFGGLALVIILKSFRPTKDQAGLTSV